MRDHEAIDRRSLAMARRIVEKIDADPRREGLEHARRVCARWVERGNVPAKEWLGRTTPSAEFSRRASAGKSIGKRGLMKRGVNARPLAPPCGERVAEGRVRGASAGMERVAPLIRPSLALRAPSPRKRGEGTSISSTDEKL